MNIAQIAKLAGVSSAAVSRYFNNGYISDEKREAIRKVVEETGYHPSTFAQTLRTNRTMMVGVIAPLMASFSVGSVVDGILDALGSSDYKMLLAVTQNDPQKELEYLRALNERQVDGVILIATVLTGEHYRVLREMKVPVVIAGQQIEGYGCVYHDDYHAMYDMTMYFLNHRRTSLAYIGVRKDDVAAGARRMEGYCDAVRAFGKPELTQRIRIGDFEMDSGAANALSLLEAYPDLDGLICATDMAAAGAVRALTQRGISVPEQIRISGQGDSMIIRAAGHEALSMHYSYEKSGSMAASMLLDLLRDKETPVNDICLGYRLVDNEGNTLS